MSPAKKRVNEGDVERERILESVEKDDSIEEKRKRRIRVLVFLVILLIVYDAIMIFAYFYMGRMKITAGYSTDNIRIDGNTIFLDSLTLGQKLSQMIIVSGRLNNPDITRMGIGGIYLFGISGKDEYASRIKSFENNSRMKLFISTDLEGYWNPFKSFYNSSSLSDIRSKAQSFQLGREHGVLLREIGFDMNFAPVAEKNGKVWDGRGFNGSDFEVADWAFEYIRGLQSSGIFSIVKHYPGGSLEKDPHKYVVKSNISGGDIFPFLVAFKNASGVMVGHVVASGNIDSKDMPCSVSKECIESIRKSGFDGLIVSDEVNMDGIRAFYKTKEEMYIDLINAGEDIILDFSLTPGSLDKLLRSLAGDVEKGVIDEEKINDAVTRILRLKGYDVR